jgi:hypothetical protein
MALVFTYGPETLQGRMYDRVGSSSCLGGAILQDYELVFDKPNVKAKEEGFANVRPAPGKQVFGVLFELTPQQVETYDGFYGGYGQKKLGVVPVGAETSRPAVVWVARRTQAGLKPSALSVKRTVQGMEENEADPAFIEAVKAMEVLG